MLTNRFKNVWLLLCAVSLSYSQSPFQLTGYWVDLPVYEKGQPTIPGVMESRDPSFLNMSRIRFRPNLSLGTSNRFVIEYEIASLYSSEVMTEPVPVEKTNRQLVKLNWSLNRGSRFLASHFIDRLFFRKDFTSGNLTIGRQRIAWGTGRVWNPTDLFNPINPANFSKIEKDGADAISLKLNLSSFTDLQTVYNAREKIAASNGAVRFRTNYHEYDFSVMGGRFDRRTILGADFAGNLFQAGFRGEGIVSADPTRFSSNFVKYILGLDYQFTAKWYALIEYQYNGQGTTDRAKYDLLKLNRGEILNLSKDYLFFQASYLIHPLVNLGLAWNVNLDDGSGFTSTTLAYSMTDNFHLFGGGLLFYGDTWDEYGYYTTSFYLRGEFFF